MKKVLMSLFCALWICSIAACGWHLRGAFELPAEWQPLAIDGANLKFGLDQALRNQFEANNISLVMLGEEESAKVILKISREQLDSNILSIGADGKAKEFELIYEVYIQLMDTDGKPILEPTPIRLRRDYSFNEGQVLGKDAEKRLLREQMVQEASMLIINKLSSSLKAHTKNIAPGG